MLFKPPMILVTLAAELASGFSAIPAPAAPQPISRPIVTPALAIQGRAVPIPTMAIAPPKRRGLRGLFASSSSRTQRRSASGLYEVSTLSPAQVIRNMANGNREYVQTVATRTGNPSEGVPTQLVTDPNNLPPLQGVIISCARSFAPVDTIFRAAPGELAHIRLCGNVAAKGDGVVGSIEYEIEQAAPPLLMVLGNTNSEIMTQAVARVLRQEGKASMLPKDLGKFSGGVGPDDLKLLDAVALSARDALHQRPGATFDKLVQLTTEINVYRSMEVLLSSSGTVASAVAGGRIEVHGAVLDVATGKVNMLGRHPAEASILSTAPVATRVVRDASSASVPPEEARAALVAGNNRFVSGNNFFSTGIDKEVLAALTSGGQLPSSIVLGCADSRAPLEILFDQQPGDLFVLRTAGNTPTMGPGALIGSADYALAVLNCKHIVVTAHTKCGAVTASVQAAIDGTDTSTIGGSIGKVVDDILDAAQATIRTLPNASLAEQVTLCTKLNVMNAIEKLVKTSPIVREKVISGEVQIDGSVYDIESGAVEWLGQHPELAKICGTPLKTYDFAVLERARAQPAGCSQAAQEALARLARGNARFANGAPWTFTMTPEPAEPFAMIVGGGELRVPIERLFDVNAGELLTQRVVGNIAGNPGGSLISSVEFAIARYNPKVLLVLASSTSRTMRTAIKRVQGGDVDSSAKGYIFGKVSVGALRAISEVEADDTVLTAAAKEMRTLALAVEYNAFYQIERLLASSIVRKAVKRGDLELHAALLDGKSGVVEMLGMHPGLEALLSSYEART